MTNDASGALTHDALVERVQLLVERQKFRPARAALAEGLRHHPESQPLLYFSAYVDWVEDQLDAAQRSLKQLLGLDPSHYGGRVLLGRLLAERKDVAGAEQTWIALLRDYPEEADLYAEYGALMMRTMHLDKARRLAEEGLRHEPEHEHCLYIVAMVELIDGRGMGENENLVRLIARHPERLRTGLALVIALQDRGRSREALRVSQQLLRSQPDSPELLENVRALKAESHWSMLPLYPIRRWGWPAAIGLWFAFAFGLPLIAPGLPRGAINVVTIVWVVYAIYSWVWPPLLRKII